MPFSGKIPDLIGVGYCAFTIMVAQRKTTAVAKTTAFRCFWVAITPALALLRVVTSGMLG
jgi:hypothetical protein